MMKTILNKVHPYVKEIRALTDGVVILDYEYTIVITVSQLEDYFKDFNEVFIEQYKENLMTKAKLSILEDCKNKSITVEEYINRLKQK